MLGLFNLSENDILANQQKKSRQTEVEVAEHIL